MKRRVIIVLIVAVLAIAGVIAGAAFYIHKTSEQHEEEEAQIQAIMDGAGDITEHVREVLSSQAPMTWVYDRDENLIMSIKRSNSLQAAQQLPQSFITGLTAVHTDIYGEVVMSYLHQQNKLGELNYQGYMRRLQADVSQVDVVRYLATTSTFGGQYTGICDAASGYFGSTLTQLNEAQYKFLLYAYRNADVSIDAYCIKEGISVDQLGLQTASTFNALRSMVSAELDNIPGVDLETGSYSVKLSISTQQQALLQSAVDMSTRGFVNVNADGSYAFDCSVILIDRVTGDIRSLVAGRSSTNIRTSLFSMNTLTLLSNISALRSRVEKDGLLSFSLIGIEQPNGEIGYYSLKDLFNRQVLSGGDGNGLMSSTVVQFVDAMFTGANGYNGVSLVSQVLDATGATVYRKYGTSLVGFSDLGMYDFFRNEVGDTLDYCVEVELESGYAYLYSTADYTMGLLVGTGALGGAIPANTRDSLKDVIIQVQTTAAGFYPVPKTYMWDASALNERILNVYAANQEFIVKSFTQQLHELQDIVIDSSEARKAFEQKFEEISSFISVYSEYVGTSCTNELTKALSDVRVGVSSLLVKYSV